MPIVLRSSIPDEVKATENRGKRAEAHVGEVSGSGAGAGGSGEPEDYDSDPQRVAEHFQQPMRLRQARVPMHPATEAGKGKS